MIDTIPKIIGGFFELEPQGTGDGAHHAAQRLSNGRACMNYILECTQPTHVFLPYYCCDTLLQPFELHGVKARFYGLNSDFEPLEFPVLQNGELFLYINYFGLKNEFVRQLVERYKGKVIIDNTQAFFQEGYSGANSFNSARKFFGVPDGSYLYSACEGPDVESRNKNFITDHLFLRKQGKQKEAYLKFQLNESMQKSDVLGMSEFSESILNNIDAAEIKEKRKANFNQYKEALNWSNEGTTFHESNDEVAFCYPYFNSRLNLPYFYNQNIFLPVLWKEVLERKADGFSFEREVANRLFALPVDHRYDAEDIHQVIKLIKDKK